jgi:tetrahydromethanopterin S-methyltransferase subunit B
MSKEPDIRKEMIEISEKIMHLETKVEKLTKSVDELFKYLRSLQLPAEGIS